MAGVLSHLRSVQREKRSQVNNQGRQEEKEIEGNRIGRITVNGLN